MEETQNNNPASAGDGSGTWQVPNMDSNLNDPATATEPKKIEPIMTEKVDTSADTTTSTPGSSAQAPLASANPSTPITLESGKITVDSVTNIPSSASSPAEVTPPTSSETPVVPSNPLESNTDVPKPPVPPTPLDSSVNSPDVKPKSGGKLGKVIFGVVIAIILLAVIGIGLVFADDKGYLETGLSSKLSFLPLSPLWGGLSSSPTSAATQVATALQSQSGLTYTGTYTGYGSEGDQLDTLSSQTGSFVLSVSGQNYSLNFTTTSDTTQVKNEYRVVDSTLYFGVKSVDLTSTESTTNSTDEKTWVQLGKAPTYTTSTVKEKISTILNNTSFVAAEEMGDDSTYHYSASVSGADIPFFSGIDSLKNWASATGTVEFWISRGTHLPVKISGNLADASTGDTMSLAATLSTSGSGVDSPVSSSTSSSSPSASSSSSATTGSDDAQRKADLKSIEAALLRYKTDHSGALPVSSSIERLDSSDSVLVKALVPSYLSVMPKDPNTSRYYGYKSDGTTYELSAVLDSATDSEGTKSGTLNLYILP